MAPHFYNDRSEPLTLVTANGTRFTSTNSDWVWQRLSISWMTHQFTWFARKMDGNHQTSIYSKQGVSCRVLGWTFRICFWIRFKGRFFVLLSRFTIFGNTKTKRPMTFRSVWLFSIWRCVTRLSHNHGSVECMGVSPRWGSFQLGQFFTSMTRWWFQIFFIFNPTWENDPIWLIFFKWVENTN